MYQLKIKENNSEKKNFLINLFKGIPFINKSLESYLNIFTDFYFMLFNININPFHFWGRWAFSLTSLEMRSIMHNYRASIRC